MADRPPFADAQAAATALRRLTMAETRALAAVKATGTLSAAAEMLGVSQPTLSQHVRDVEEKLGLKLFLRHRRGIEPTSAGAVMLRLAGALQVDLSWAAEELAVAARADQRPLRVGSMAVTSGGLVAVALGRFAESGGPPTVLVEGPRELLLEHLLRGRIDLFVGRLPDESDCAGLRRELLFLDTCVIVTAARHPMARRSQVPAPALAAQSWILPAEDTAFHEQVERTFRRAGLQLPRARVVTYSMVSIPAIVATSQLLGFLPTSLYAAGAISAGLHRLRVALDWVPSEVGLLMRSDAESSDRLQGLLQVLRSVAASARSAATLDR